MYVYLVAISLGHTTTQLSLMLFPLVQMFHQDANLRRTCACSEPFCLDMQFFFNLKVENG